MSYVPAPVPEQLLVSRRGEPSRRAGRAGACARARGAGPDRPRRRVRHGAGAREGEGAGRAPDRRGRGDHRRWRRCCGRGLRCCCRRRGYCCRRGGPWRDRRGGGCRRRGSRSEGRCRDADFHLRAARGGPNRLRQSLPADHRRSSAPAQGGVARHLAGGVRAGRGARRPVGRGAEPAGAGRGADRGRRTAAGGLRRPAVRAGDPAPPGGGGAPGSLPAAACGACRAAAGRRHRGALPHAGAPRPAGRPHLHPARRHAGPRRAG